MIEMQFTNEDEFRSFLVARHEDGCDVSVNQVENFGKDEKSVWAYVHDWTKSKTQDSRLTRVDLATA